ncbi:MAG: DUF1598 domain-containing protein [Planctomycetaceae bacterium]|jgi:hypothetical protein|nr:DUF1598 domain-containing protein [Planctomycetaceae bacterium]
MFLRFTSPCFVFRCLPFFTAALWLAVCALLFPAAAARAQNSGSGATGGILVNAKGELLRNASLDLGQLSRTQIAAAKASYAVPRDAAVPSPMRCISLNRLEKAAVQAGGTLTEEMRYLAGIQRIKYVFYFPDSKDVVIAGNAEGWFPGYEGAMIGRSTLQPVCELQDLAAALRVFAPNRDDAGTVGCSIDPTEEGNVRLNRFLKEFGSVGGPKRYDAFIRGIRENLGAQKIRIDGISPKTHAAQMMVAADYRMKLLGLGFDSVQPVRLDTFIGNTVPGASNRLFRWYFVPDYESVILTEDRTGLELIGEGVKLIAENEQVDSAGKRAGVTGALDPGSAAFTRSFTKQYPLIAKRALVFAQLRNWIDMLIGAAHIKTENFYGKAGWSMEFFGDEKKFPLETFNEPKEVEPLVGRVVKRGVLMAPVGGGIVIDAETALDKDHAKTDTERLSKVRKNIRIDLPENAWWWDVK